MTPVTGIAKKWAGLCRKSPVTHSLPLDPSELSEPAHEGLSEGGAIRAGINTLIHNPQLFWFSLFAGLIVVGNVIGQTLLFLTSTNREPDILVWYTLMIVIESLTVFCMVFLLAGLVLGISSRRNGGTVSIFQGFTAAKNYLKPLAGWSVVLAIAGYLLFLALESTQSISSRTFNIFGNIQTYFFTVLNCFPFYFALDPHIILEPFNMQLVGPRPPTLIDLLGYPDPLINTLIFSAINILLFALTLFVVPQIVIEKKNLKDAVRGSFALMKKSWHNIAAWVLGFGVVVFAASLSFLLFQFTGFSTLEVSHGTTSVSSSRPSDVWMVAGDLYVLALVIVVFIMVTVCAIASLDLYRSARTGQVPGSTRTEQVL